MQLLREDVFGVLKPFDPKVISYKNLLYVFLRTHDPVQLSRQGADAGTLYRSVILYHDDRQRKLAEEALNFIQNDSYRKVVTELVLFEKFYEGEDYHQNYHAQNPDKIFCKLVVDPKIQKLKKDFKKYLK